ncbi:uncharacterized protein PV07_01915 [Cladophialophora immunda]|uniref:Uncharacterized protein n=1 Tax=Cladophialophora immunda TaxID=569365 RepID=A0A0D2CZ28_9EURO|nr:uncharacterized protein PV07_01915 [Cladophialophora immunda]KIW35205.1 hypothetical protein PV07_01915 [Cladophialophora immunda]
MKQFCLGHECTSTEFSWPNVHSTRMCGQKSLGSQVVLVYPLCTLKANGAGRDGQYLRFPNVHREIIKQRKWHVSELMGRIRVVIAEGVLRDNTPPAVTASRFDRLRDVVAFSFQHAPQDVLEYSRIAWPNLKMFTSLPRNPPRPAPIGSRVPGISGHEAHSHSPQRLPPIASRSKRLSTNENYQELFDTQSYSELQPDPISKVPNVGALKSQSPGRQVPLKLVAQDDDPFASSHQIPTAIQQWRLQLRSSSHDISMPDYTSSKTDRSVVNTEMSGVSIPRANFLRHMNEANPEEILQALSPSRQEELFKALSASHSPATDIGTRPPTNTPQIIDDFTTPRVMHSGGANDMAIAKIWQEPRQRRRTCSLASSRSTSEPMAQLTKEQTSPRLPRGLVAPTDGKSQLSAASRSLSLGINRQRSASNGSKRKRGSTSPGLGIGKIPDTIQVVVCSSSSSASDGDGEEQGETKSVITPGNTVAAVAE